MVALADVVRTKVASASDPVSQGTLLSPMALDLMFLVFAAVVYVVGCCFGLL